ncbi:MAG TPA: hypothetical protein PLJ78_04840 [Anaerolineae bacterium]|nr:hypothetical protein [Anaerolineae bacterium]HQK13259.1 hypothetical protein [Anaerolineae bacterium]
MSGRAYELIRALVERLGGSMYYERKGHRYGAWVIRIDESNVTIESSGNRSFPELDRLYVPRVPNPRHWDDYLDELVPDAEARLLSLLGISEKRPKRLPDDEIEELAQLVERAKWKFAWTYARTYPHEYTTRVLCNPEDHARLIECIERYGVVERFGKSRRKYFYFQERKYWHMGDPHSENPDDWPNVINRTWVDVRRHAENVRHVWTPEKVELQMRLWEIQLEKSTDRPKSEMTP